MNTAMKSITGIFDQTHEIIGHGRIFRPHALRKGACHQCFADVDLAVVLDAPREHLGWQTVDPLDLNERLPKALPDQAVIAFRSELGAGRMFALRHITVIEMNLASCQFLMVRSPGFRKLFFQATSQRLRDLHGCRDEEVEDFQKATTKEHLKPFISTHPLH